MTTPEPTKAQLLELAASTEPPEVRLRVALGAALVLREQLDEAQRRLSFADECLWSWRERANDFARDKHASPEDHARASELTRCANQLTLGLAPLSRGSGR